MVERTKFKREKMSSCKKILDDYCSEGDDCEEDMACTSKYLDKWGAAGCYDKGQLDCDLAIADDDNEAEDPYVANLKLFFKPRVVLLLQSRGKFDAVADAVSTILEVNEKFFDDQTLSPASYVTLTLKAYNEIQRQTVGLFDVHVLEHIAEALYDVYVSIYRNALPEVYRDGQADTNLSRIRHSAGDCAGDMYERFLELEQTRDPKNSPWTGTRFDHFDRRYDPSEHDPASPLTLFTHIYRLATYLDGKRGAVAGESELANAFGYDAKVCPAGTVINLFSIFASLLNEALM